MMNGVILYFRTIRGAVVAVTTAEIKPFEPETGNAGVGKEMTDILLHFIGAFRTDMPRTGAEFCSGKDFRYVSGKHYLHSNHQQIQRKTH